MTGRSKIKFASSLFATLATVICVQPVGAEPPADAVPFYCSTAVGIGLESLLSCRRSDTRALVTPVPVGVFLHVTDVIVNPNNSATSGTFTAIIGRDDNDNFPGQPSLDLIGSPTQLLLHETPHIILSTGESLAVSNSSSSSFPIDVRASGFIAQSFTAPLVVPIFQDGFE